MEYCEVCGSIIQDKLCSNRRCSTRNEPMSSWIIGGILWRFKRPVTLAEAKKAIKDKSDLVYIPQKKQKDSFSNLKW
jgi:hypothetical protein